MKHLRLIALGVSLLAAAHTWAAEATYEPEITLKNGSTVIVFGDGDMAMRDRRGIPYSMESGRPMETKDGKTIIMGKDNPLRKSRLEKEREDLYRGG